jgi:glycosyltransferase involved in cell wall biosynthesis
MKVVHLYRYSYPPVYGGIPQHIHTLVHQLKQSARPELLVSGKTRSWRLDAGIPVHSVGAWGQLQGAPLSPTLPYWIRRSRADLLHFHMPSPTGELAYLMSRARIPYVATYHSDIIRQARALRIYRPFLDAFLRGASRIIVGSPHHLASSPILSAYREKCRIIPYGIDVARFEATPSIQHRAAAFRQQFGQRLVLFVGNFCYYKGLSYLVRAMAQVPGRLLLIGGGYEEPRLRALAAELRLQDRIVWLAHLEAEEFVAALHACDVLALPSIYRSEAFGIAQLEAHACGKPVVSTALGTGVEYANLHERTGLVVPPQNVDALAAALDRLLSDPEYRLQLGSAALARVRAEFTQERMAAAVLEMYREVLRESDRAWEGQRDPSTGPTSSDAPGLTAPGRGLANTRR